MSIIRIEKTEKFTVVSNTHINDDRLTWKATAILTYLLSKPNDWTVYVKQLAKAKKCGIKAVYSGIRELKALGYIQHVSIRDDTAKITRWEYIVHEEPAQVENTVVTERKPQTQKGKVALGEVGNRHPLLKTEGVLKNDDDQPPPPISFSDLGKLVSEIPAEKQTPQVTAKIRKALQAGYLHQYLALAIAYSLAHSNGNFPAYLGKCIDGGWAEGWDPAEKKEQAQVDHQAYLDQVAMDQEQERDRQKKKQALAELKRDPEKYRLALQDAAAALDIDLNRKKRGDALRLDLYIQESI